MAIIRTSSGPDAVLNIGRKFFHRRLGPIRDALARRRTYRTTYDELWSLTDRDLNDLGISRFDIRKLALETAYGD